MVLENWRTRQLSDLVEFSSGNTPSKQDADFWGGTFPWVSAKDMKQAVIKDAELKLTQQGYEKSKSALPGSLLILVRGMTLLKDLPVGFVEKEVAFNQDIKALKPKGDLSGRFLLYALMAHKQRILVMPQRNSPNPLRNLRG